MNYKKDEYKELYRITKPLRFRRLKMIKQITFDWFSAIRERIIYLYYIILYKLNIIKRCNYRDNGEDILPLPHPTKFKRMETDVLEGEVIMKMIHSWSVESDYFYSESKEKGRKIKYVIKDNTTSRWFTEVSLTNLSVKIDGKNYYVQHLPTLKMAIAKPIFDIGCTIDSIEYDTVTIDVDRLKKIRSRTFLGNNDVSKEELEYLYDCSYDYLVQYCEKIRLADLILKRGAKK